MAVEWLGRWATDFGAPRMLCSRASASGVDFSLLIGGGLDTLFTLPALPSVFRLAIASGGGCWVELSARLCAADPVSCALASMAAFWL